MLSLLYTELINIILEYLEHGDIINYLTVMYINSDEIDINLYLEKIMKNIKMISENDEDMMKILHMKHLKHLTITAVNLNTLSCLKNIEYLDISLSGREDMIIDFQFLSELTKLKVLIMDNIYYDTIINFSDISKLNNLEKLSMTCNTFLLDSDLISLSNLNLKHLDLEECENITEDGLIYIGQITSLTSLNIAGIEPTGNCIIESLKLLTNLQNLNLRGTLLADSDILYLISILENLHEIDIRDCSNITKNGCDTMMNIVFNRQNK